MTLPLTVLQNLAKQQGEDSTDVFQMSIVDRYWLRPVNKQFQDMCLADFVANYKLVQNKTVVDQEKSDDSDPEEETTVFKLLDNKGTISRRKKQAVIRYLKVSKSKDSERHYCTLLRLYMPHRGKDLKTEEETFEEIFLDGELTIHREQRQVRDIVIENMEKYEHCAEVVDAAWTVVQQREGLEEGWAEVAPGAEELRHDAQDEIMEENMTDDEETPEIPDLDIGLRSNNYGPSGSCAAVEVSTQKISTEDAKSILRNMNRKQRELFMELRQWCLDKVTGRPIKPFQLFMTGGAGTGKSHLINGFQYEASRLFAPITGEESPMVSFSIYSHVHYHDYVD